MKQDYFIHEGAKYYTGTEIRILKYPYNDPVFSDLAYFVYYDTEHDIYVYRMKHTRQIFIDFSIIFKDKFGGVTGGFNKSIRVPQTKQLKDWQISSLLVGWIWYIFIMAVGIIFNDRLVIWALASVVFFNYRKKKIEEEGYYVEW